MTSELIKVDVFYSMRSPYSYLASSQMMDLEKKYNIKLNVRMVYPLAIRYEGFFQKADPLFPMYLLRDTFRISQMKNIPFGAPNPDPIIQNYPDVAKEQPYIYRLTRLATLACLNDKGLEFLNSVGQLIWGGQKGWNEGSYLEDTLNSVGLKLSEMDKEISERENELEDIISKNQDDQRIVGHWGVPLFGFNGEPFFGQDRIDLLIWRLKQHGLVER